MSLTFYYSPQSSAVPVHWTLEELGIPYEKVKLDLQGGDQKKADFLKLNPNAKVPLLVHDGSPIFESAAIQMYLGELYGVDKGLYPAPGPRRGEAMKWIVWTNVTLGDSLSRYSRGMAMWGREEERNEKSAAIAKAEIVGHLQILEDALAGKNYLLGDNFTIADLHVAAWMTYLKMMNIDLAPYKKIGAWVSRCTARPAFAATN